MSFRVSLVLRLWLVVLVALIGAVAWAVAGSNSAARSEVRATEARVAYKIERLYMLGSAWNNSLGHMARSSIGILSVMAPGTCVEFSGDGLSGRRLCAGWNVFGDVAPGWFLAALNALNGRIEPLDRELPLSGVGEYRLTTSFDPVAMATRTWQQVQLLSGIACLMAVAILVLGTGAIAHALRPVQRIVDGLDRLASGGLDHRLPRFRIEELDRIARSVNELAGRLETTAAEREDLMQKVLDIQDEERRLIAQELHDEFGQCLTAVAAVAASIEMAAAADRPDVAEDARSIGMITRQMMDSIRGALARLRPPDLDEIGLEASLHAMLGTWKGVLRGRTRLSLSAPEPVGDLPPKKALCLYRIAQECVTNAARHGAPTEIAVTLRRDRPDGAVRLTVTDDGGGAAGQIGASPGNGILGIRERLAAFGGSLSIRETPSGVRVEAMLPDAGAAHRPVPAGVPVPA